MFKNSSKNELFSVFTEKNHIFPSNCPKYLFFPVHDSYSKQKNQLAKNDIVEN
jgi:hypothetical protein